MLLNAGADIDLANHNGGTPLMWLGCPVLPFFPFLGFRFPYNSL